MIRVANSDPSRCKAADEFLKAGKAISIGDYCVRLVSPEVAEVCIPTKWEVSNQSEERQAEELHEAKQFFRDTVPVLPYLGKSLIGLKFSFIIINDYGNGAVDLTAPTTPDTI